MVPVADGHATTLGLLEQSEPDTLSKASLVADLTLSQFAAATQHTLFWPPDGHGESSHLSPRAWRTCVPGSWPRNLGLTSPSLGPETSQPDDDASNGKK
ncbi:hypothetical protein CI238_09763 [Colletotrichum incanum]|uniref:Uncharacterized protein n=1 Tax=Colletotrichum incanum TaxID=1573173 RepID=A0A162P993_COLIC|nr:hypothetical protein CI238_09763 [Colletotrichum incanum]